MMSPARIGRSRDGEPLAVSSQPADRRGDGAGEPRARLARRARAAILTGHRRPSAEAGHGGHSSTMPGLADCARRHDGSRRRRATPPSAAVAGEDRIDRSQHRLGRAERDVERHMPPWPLRLGDARLEMRAHRDEGARVGALKAVDRLLGVADREHGAHARRAGLRRRRIPRREPRRSPIARDWCPAPRRSGCDRARHRA